MKGKMEISVEYLSKAFGEHQVFDNLSLRFEDGSRTCLMGPSGCGKTTLLYLLMGLMQPDSGRIELPKNCRMGVVFQENRLLEHRSTLSNLRLVCGREISDDRLEEALLQVGISQEFHGRPARELSGGMARRVAIVRALLPPSEVILLDEPLKGLDGQNRELTLSFILRELRGRTLIAVSHDERDPAGFDARVVRLAGGVEGRGL